MLHFDTNRSRPKETEDTCECPESCRLHELFPILPAKSFSF